MPETGLAHVHEEFTLTIDKTIQGPRPHYLPLECKFEYTWDFDRGRGYATFVSINGAVINEDMPPEGIAGELAFSSKKRFYVILPYGPRIYIYFTSLIVKKNSKSAALKIGEQGHTIVATSNWGHHQASLLMEIQEQETG